MKIISKLENTKTFVECCRQIQQQTGASLKGVMTSEIASVLKIALYRMPKESSNETAKLEARWFLARGMNVLRYSRNTQKRGSTGQMSNQSFFDIAKKEMTLVTKTGKVVTKS